MNTITIAALLAQGGAADATHAIFNPNGSLYCCAILYRIDDAREVEYWEARGYTMKRVEREAT